MDLDQITKQKSYVIEGFKQWKIEIIIGFQPLNEEFKESDIAVSSKTNFYEAL